MTTDAMTPHGIFSAVIFSVFFSVLGIEMYRSFFRWLREPTIGEKLKAVSAVFSEHYPTGDLFYRLGRAGLTETMALRIRETWREQIQSEKKRQSDLNAIDVDDLRGQLQVALKECERLKAGKFSPTELQNLCHNLDESDYSAFCDGCSRYQKELFGKSREESLKEIYDSIERELSQLRRDYAKACPLSRANAGRALIAHELHAAGFTPSDGHRFEKKMDDGSVLSCRVDDRNKCCVEWWLSSNDGVAGHAIQPEPRTVGGLAALLTYLDATK